MNCWKRIKLEKKENNNVEIATSLKNTMICQSNDKWNKSNKRKAIKTETTIHIIKKARNIR